MLHLLKKHKISPVLLFIEVVAIFLSLSLAFLISETRQHYSNQAKAQHALTSIYREISINKKFIDDRMPYYQKMADTLRTIMENNGADMSMREVELDEFRGLLPPLIRQSSFQMALSTGAFSYIDYKMADHIGTIYSFQNFYKDIIDKYGQAFTNGNLTQVRHYRGFFAELSTVGTELVQNYQYLLSDLEGIGAGKKDE